MKKKLIVRSSKDFEDIITNGNHKKNSSFIIHSKDNNLSYDRYGISVSKKLGNAVFRNKYKRKIRSIIDIYKKNCFKMKDYIIILRKGALNKSFQDLKKELIDLLMQN